MKNNVFFYAQFMRFFIQKIIKVVFLYKRQRIPAAFPAFLSPNFQGCLQVCNVFENVHNEQINSTQGIKTETCCHLNLHFRIA